MWNGAFAVWLGSRRSRASIWRRTPTRTVSLRLDRRDRSARSAARAGQAHRARPLRARRRESGRRARTAASPCTWATTTSSNTSTSSSPTAASMRRIRAANRDLLDRGTLVRRALRRERSGAVAAAGVRSEGSAECGRWLSRSGGCADQGARGGERARRNADGSTGGCRSESRRPAASTSRARATSSAPRPRRHMTYAGREVESGPDRGESARRESVRAHHRDSRSRRRSHRARVFVGSVPARAAIRPADA